ncbi:hypothetical protein NE237_010685 [Protea cynaroides]|uniref:Protein kinase domain-containing protein n=1 Tax=Protea cynaroides TaxID=273540 RepID=A0A9Q0R1X3_9MAGN|nr:hypothetical protein NE237_010685 [Protea cynaroides]
MQKTSSSQFLLQSQRKQNISAHRRTPISSPSPSRKDYFNRSLQNKCTSPSFTRFVTKKLSSLFTAFLSCRNGGTERIKPEGKNQSHSKEISRSTNKSSKRFKYAGSKSSSNSTNTKNGVLFSIEEIYKATENFSPANKIGDGGFGTVYKGKLRDGTVVAIKRAQKNMYDKHLSAEFKTEIQTLSTIEHLNLVRLLGYLEEKEERIIVMEYVSNGTLRQHLDGFRGQWLELAERLAIAIDIAHAVTYLHTYTGNAFTESRGCSTSNGSKTTEESGGKPGGREGYEIGDAMPRKRQTV